MNPRTIKSLSFALVGLLLFFAVVILFRVYSEKEIPAQFTGALLGAIVTAAITMALLHGQSQAEETKERNVKVFEEKSRRYNEFLEKLWKVWEDRHVSLEELNDLMQSVSKDIIIYTKAENSKKIIRSLKIISNDSNNSESTDKEDDSKGPREKIQNEIFSIINTIAEDLGLGGSIDGDVQKDLEELEKTIRPFLLAKVYRQRLLDDVENVIKRTELQVDLGKPYYEDWAGNEYLWTKVADYPIELGIGPVSLRSVPAGRMIGFFVESLHNPEFHKYRQSPRDFGKNFLCEMRWDSDSDHRIANAIPDFNKSDSVEKWVSRHRNPSEGKNPGTIVGEMLVQYAKEWIHEGKDIKSIIYECYNLEA